MQVNQAARPCAKIVRNQRKMQGSDQLQQHHAQRDRAWSFRGRTVSVARPFEIGKSRGNGKF